MREEDHLLSHLFFLVSLQFINVVKNNYAILNEKIYVAMDIKWFVSAIFRILKYSFRSSFSCLKRKIVYNG